jgi:hypothetical protein
MYPHERSLVQQMTGRPFVLLGVNSDKDRDGLKNVLPKLNITWRSFWNGPEGTNGPISTRWNIQGWPTLYVLDADGVIRYKWLDTPGDKVLSAAVEKLVRDAEGRKK